MNDSMLAAPPHRNRMHYAIAIILVIGLGLFVRSRYFPLSAFVAKYAGDALWALVVFLGWGWLLRAASTRTVTLLALGFSWTIEFLQLYQAPWIQTLRANRFASSVLGNTFNWPDLIAYALGIAIGVAVECACRSCDSDAV